MYIYIFTKNTYGPTNNMVFEHINSHTLKPYRKKTVVADHPASPHTPFICKKNTRFRLRFWVQLAMQIAYLKLYFGRLTAWQFSCVFFFKMGEREGKKKVQKLGFFRMQGKNKPPRNHVLGILCCWLRKLEFCCISALIEEKIHYIECFWWSGALNRMNRCENRLLKQNDRHG